MDNKKITQLSCARKLKDTDPRADMECGEKILTGINGILNRIDALLYQSNEQVSLFVLKAGLSPETFVLDENQFALETENAIQFFTETGVSDITLSLKCEYVFDDPVTGIYYLATANGASIPLDEAEEEDMDDDGTLCEERIFVTLARHSDQGTYYFTSDCRWEKDQKTDDRLAVLGEDDTDTARGRFAEDLVNWRPDIGKKTFRKRLAETAMLCTLSDSLPDLMSEEWIEAENGKLIPVLFPMDDKRHGIFVSTSDGKYQIHAGLDSDDFSWYDGSEHFLRHQCIFSTDDVEQAKRYLCGVIDHYTMDDVWSFPLSGAAYLVLQEDKEPLIYTLDGQRTISAQEQKNGDTIMDWLQDMSLQMLDLSEDERKHLAELTDDEDEEEYEDEGSDQGTKMLNELLTSLPELLCKEWMLTERGGKVPVLAPADKQNHGFNITEHNGEYQINAYMDAHDFSWYGNDPDPYYMLKCIFTTSDIKKVKQYVRNITNHDVKEDVWLLPLSDRAVLEMKKYGQMKPIVIGELRELTEEEYRNFNSFDDWFYKIELASDCSDEYDEDEEYEGDDQGEEYEDETEYEYHHYNYYEDYDLEMLHSLSDSLPGVFRTKWIHPTGRGRMPVLSLTDEKKHGLAISTEGGEYHVNAYLLTLDVPWYDKGLEPYSRLSCIFTTSDIEKVRQYVCDVINCKCNAKEDTWLFPLSDQAIGKMSKYGDVCPVILSGESRELTNEEKVNVNVCDDWYEKLFRSSDWCEEDEEWEEDEEDNGESD